MAVLALFFLFVVPARARQGGGMYERLRGLTVEQINQKGEDCIRAGRHDSAIAYYQAAADRYDDGMDAGEKRICVDAMCNAGAMAFADRHDYVGAYALLVKALGVAEDNGFDYIKPYVYLNLAGVHTVFGDSTMNDRLCRKAFEMGKRLNDAYIYKLAFVELVYTAAAGGNFEAIRNELADFGRSWPDMGKGERDYAMLIHLGISAYSKGRYAEALGCYDEADRLVGGLLEADLYHLIIDMLAARAYSAQGRYAEAVARLKPNIGNDIYQHALNDAYRTLSVFYAKAGQADSAKEYKVKSLLIKDDALDYDGYMRLRDVERRYLPADIVGGRGGGASPLVPWLLAVAGAVLLLLVLWRLGAAEKRAGGNAADRREPTRARAKAYAPTHGLPDEKTQEMARGVKAFMETSPEIYGYDFSLEKLAQQLGTHPRTASRAINDVFGVNFSTLLSQYRVKEACRRLSSDDYSNVTIQAIATDVGFKSRTNFAAVFKKLTGLSPNEYQKKALAGGAQE